MIYIGFGIRLSGEDVGRGTFSQRHAMLVDQKSGQIIVPLNSLVENQAEKLEVRIINHINFMKGLIL